MNNAWPIKQNLDLVFALLIDPYKIYLKSGREEGIIDCSPICPAQGKIQQHEMWLPERIARAVLVVYVIQKNLI